jgi:hypothetical protein
VFDARRGASNANFCGRLNNLEMLRHVIHFVRFARGDAAPLPADPTRVRRPGWGKQPTNSRFYGFGTGT